MSVSWSGTDGDGSGVASYDVYVSEDGGPFEPWLTATTATAADFDGTAGHTYDFAAVATDNVGRREPGPGAAEAGTSVVEEGDEPPLPPEGGRAKGKKELRNEDGTSFPGERTTFEFDLDQKKKRGEVETKGKVKVDHHQKATKLKLRFDAKHDDIERYGVDAATGEIVAFGTAEEKHQKRTYRFELRALDAGKDGEGDRVTIVFTPVDGDGPSYTFSGEVVKGDVEAKESGGA